MGPSSILPANVGVLDAVADATGTVISVDTVMNCVRVSGQNTEDVDEALGKLTRCAFFLVSTSSLSRLLALSFVFDLPI